MKTKQIYDPHVGCLYSNLSQRVGVRFCADQHASYRARNCASRPDEFIVGAKSMNEILEEYYVLGYLSCDTQAVRGDSVINDVDNVLNIVAGSIIFSPTIECFKLCCKKTRC